MQVLLADAGAGFGLHQSARSSSISFKHKLIPWLSINSLSVSLEPSLHKQLIRSLHHRSGSEAFGDASPAAAAAPGANGSRRGSNVSVGGEGDDAPGGGGIRRLLSRKLSRNRCARGPARPLLLRIASFRQARAISRETARRTALGAVTTRLTVAFGAPGASRCRQALVASGRARTRAAGAPPCDPSRRARAQAGHQHGGADRAAGRAAAGGRGGLLRRRHAGGAGRRDGAAGAPPRPAL